MPGTFLVHCEQSNCYMHMTVNTEEEQQYYLANHGCPYWGGESKVSWSVTKTLVQQMWDKLDAELDEIKGHWRIDGGWVSPSLVDPEYHKVRARALAECIAIFMTPFFETADDIAHEAMRRWEARRDSNDEYETPGLGARRYETAAQAHLSATPGWYGTAQDGYTANPDHAGTPTATRTRTRTAAPPRAVTIKPEDETAMQKAYEAMPQIFTPATLAKQYGYPEPAVRKLLGLD